MNIQDKINTILLCDIAKHLGIETEIDTDLVKYAVVSGNLWLLDAHYYVFSEVEPTKEDRDFVVNVLNMYRGLSAAMKKFSQDVQQKLIDTNNLHIIDHSIQIPGFDGNKEAMYFSIFGAFRKLDRFAEQKGPITDTHTATKIKYDAMLEAYKQCDPVNRNFALTVEEVSTILGLAPVGL